MSHKHEVYDTDKHYIINATTHIIKSDGILKNLLVQGDHNSERLTFEIPRMIEGHDMDLCDRIEIHYLNGENKGLYLVDDKQLSTDGESVLFSWLVSSNATSFVDVLSFSIKFICTENEEVVYKWQTQVFSQLQISASIENVEQVVNTSADVLGKWKEEVLKAMQVDRALNTDSSNPISNSTVANALNNKVNIEQGKGLSSNDFTDDLVQKLKTLFNYDDSELKNQIASLTSELAQFVTNATPTADNEVIDSRVGFDGTSYESLGVALRAQIQKLYNLCHDTFYDVKQYLEEVESGKYYNGSSGSIAKVSNATANIMKPITLPKGTYYLYNVYGFFSWIEKNGTVTRVTDSTSTKYCGELVLDDNATLYITVGSNHNDYFMYDSKYAYDNHLSVGRYINTELLAQYRTTETQKAIDDGFKANLERLNTQRITNIITVKKDGKGDYTTLKEALDSIKDASDMNRYEVHIYSGVYDILEELGGTTYLNSITDTSHVRLGLKVPCNVSIIGHGHVVLQYRPNDNVSNINTTTCISPLEVYGNTRLENLTIDCYNARYCVHDETNNNAEYDNMYHEYVNCYFIHDGNVLGGWKSNASIGIGTSSGCTYKFEDSSFFSDGFYAWLLHNNANQESLYISFNGCEFYGNYKNASIKLGYLGKNESICDVWLKNCMSDNGLLIKKESQSIASDDVYVIHNFTNIEQTKE